MIGPDAAAIDILNKAIEEEEPSGNYYAAIAVGTIGPEAKQAVPALLELMKGNKATKEIVPNLSVAYEVRKRGEHTVVEVGPGIPSLPGTGTVGYAAFWALLQIDAEIAKDALPR